MKCQHCLALNAPNDTECVRCRQQLSYGPTEAQIRANTPQWVYFFVALCGVLPILTLGGLIPVVVGFGGAGSCLQVSRVQSLPGAARVLVCVAITVACWLVVGLLVLVVMGWAPPIPARR